MNTVINSNQNSVVEFAKRSFYSFQVLIVGVAIPFLFLFGISNIHQNKTEDNEQEEVTNSVQQSARPVIGFYIPRI